MAPPDDANRRLLLLLPYPPVYPKVKKWLDPIHTGTRRFYLFSLDAARPPDRLYLSLPNLRLGT